MRLNILFSGEAGQGINELAKLFSIIIAKKGFYIFNYRDYGSLIRGGNSFNIVSISDKPIKSHENSIDILVALNESSLNFHEKNLKNGMIISENKGIKVESQKIIEKAGIDKRVSNVIYLSALIKILGLDLEILEKQLKIEFKGKKLLEDDLKAAKLGYEAFESKKILDKFKIDKKEREVIDGSEAMANAAIESGIDLYFAYPMTPATGLLHQLAEKEIEEKNKNKFLVFQPENEIAVANMALGASFAGARVMIGTSGGGYDLMTEALSMQGMSQLPLIMYLASRPGPATGIPTHTMQSDLNIALYSGHGEFPRVVIAPGDPEEVMETTNKAFYLSQKYRCLVTILSDKHLAESLFTIDKIPKLKLIKAEIEKTDKNYQLNPNGISKRCVPDLAICKASSYTHNEYGITTEDGKINEKVLDNLKKKKESLNSEILSKIETIKEYGSGKILILGTGSVKGAILDSIDELKAKFLHILYLDPLNIEKLEKEIKKANKVFCVEINSTGQLADLIENKVGKDKKIKRILKYDARPFTPSNIIKAIRGKK